MSPRKSRSRAARALNVGQARGFWSYARADDRADRGRIQVLAQDVAAQYEMMTGEPIQQFFDQQSLAWGDDWRQEIDEYLEVAAFFIPIITPRYLRSEQCRREFRSFAGRAETIGLSELILPLYYVDVPSWNDGTTDDELLELLRRFQYMDWRDWRFKEIDSEEYRRGVWEMVSRLVAANQHAETREHPSVEEAEEEVATEDESPGKMDHLAEAEEVLPKLSKTIQAIAAGINTVGELMQGATSEMLGMPASRATFGNKRAIARRLAHKLEVPVQTIVETSNTYVSQMHKLDEGIRVMVELGTQELAGANEEQRADLLGLFRSVGQLAVKTDEGLQAVRGMVASATRIETLSRDLRPVLRRLSRGLTSMMEAKALSDRWVRLIRNTGIEVS